MGISVTITDSLEKIFVDAASAPAVLERMSVLRDETAYFQIAVRADEVLRNTCLQCSHPEAVKVFMTDHVSSHFTTMPGSDDFMLDRIGLYPEVIRPLNAADIYLRPKLYVSLWVEADASRLKTGDNVLCFSLTDNSGAVVAQSTITVEVVGVRLGTDGFKVINWLHCDCLADYYGIEIFGEKHFSIIENFIKTAVEHEINTVYVPCFTPALDTAPGTARTVCQLVDIFKNGNDYTFGWAKLDRFIEICKRQGVAYYEICHLFSQWGAEGCPEIYAHSDGAHKKIFGRETDAADKSYRDFLKRFLPELKSKLESAGIWDKTFLHISDEPGKAHLNTYNAHLDFVKNVLPDSAIIDALSDYAFAGNENLTYPVVALNHTGEFIKNKKDIFVYYCTSQYKDYVPNRFFNIPSQRNRILGMLMYRNNAKGFLHWGYNFYNSYWSLEKINPYLITDAGGKFQSGDAFSVYPSHGGEAFPSLRLKVFAQGVKDYRALITLEKLIGREETLNLLEARGIKEGYSGYPHEKRALLELREEINRLIKETRK